MNAPESRLIVPAIGAQLAGGTVLGHQFVAGEPFALIVPAKAVRGDAPVSSAPKSWSPNTARVEGALSFYDGLANTRAMAAAGSLLGQWALDQRIEGYSDWFIGARVDQLIIRSNIGPAVPAYQQGGDEAFRTDDWYWTSTQNEFYAAWAWLQYFDDGYQDYYRKSNEGLAFVLRREPIQ